jgi:pyridoxal phosphate enzyme (YggS family)
MSELAARLDAIRARIAAAAAGAGRSPAEVQLVAVSKTFPPESLLEAGDAGQTLFGESRVQEARAKIPLLPGRFHWHFIGHLQRNKIRQALPLFELFHGIDSLDLARDLQRVADELGLRPALLLEVNLAGESSKFGFAPDRLRADFEDLLGLDRLEIRGLMTVPPAHPDPAASRPYFAALRELRDELQTTYRAGLPELSMGMSNDFETAIAEGATLVRVGSAIFGERPRPPRPADA